MSTQAALDIGFAALEPRSVTVGLERIQPNSELLAPEPDAAFLDTIRHGMLIYPVILREGRLPAHDYQVIDGRRRVKAARMVQAELTAHPSYGPAGVAQACADRRIDPLPALLFPAGYSDTAILGALLNTHRRENLLTNLEAVERWKAMPNVPETDFAHALRVSVGTLRRWITLTRLLPEFRVKLEAGELSQAKALALAKLAPELQQRAYQAWSLDGKAVLTGQFLRALQEIRAEQTLATLPLDLLNGPTPAAPTPIALPPGITEHVCDLRLTKKEQDSLAEMCRVLGVESQERLSEADAPRPHHHELREKVRELKEQLVLAHELRRQAQEHLSEVVDLILDILEEDYDVETSDAMAQGIEKRLAVHLRPRPPKPAPAPEELPSE